MVFRDVELEVDLSPNRIGDPELKLSVSRLIRPALGKDGDLHEGRRAFAQKTHQYCLLSFIKVTVKDTNLGSNPE